MFIFRPPSPNQSQAITANDSNSLGILSQNWLIRYLLKSWNVIVDESNNKSKTKILFLKWRNRKYLYSLQFWEVVLCINTSHILLDKSMCIKNIIAWLAVYIFHKSILALVILAKAHALSFIGRSQDFGSNLVSACVCMWSGISSLGLSAVWVTDKKNGLKPAPLILFICHVCN